MHMNANSSHVSGAVSSRTEQHVMVSGNLFFFSVVKNSIIQLKNNNRITLCKTLRTCFSFINRMLYILIASAKIWHQVSRPFHMTRNTAIFRLRIHSQQKTGQSLPLQWSVESDQNFEDFSLRSQGWSDFFGQAPSKLRRDGRGIKISLMSLFWLWSLLHT